MHRLRTALRVNDGQPGMQEGCVFGKKLPPSVRTSAPDGILHFRKDALLCPQFIGK